MRDHREDRELAFHGCVTQRICVFSVTADIEDMDCVCEEMECACFVK